jgi:hypothetical protein
MTLTHEEKLKSYTRWNDINRIIYEMMSGEKS